MSDETYSHWRTETTALGPAVVCDYAENGYALYVMTWVVASASALRAHGFADRHGDLRAAVDDGEGDVLYIWCLLGEFAYLDSPICGTGSDGELSLIPPAFRHLLDDGHGWAAR